MIELSNTSLVETAWLARHLADPNLCIVDARCWGRGPCRQRFLDQHIPGAVHLCWHTDLSHTQAGVRYLILPSDQFAAVMGQVGIGPQTRVVVYAEADQSGPARLWWALRYYGHAQVAVLNGGLNQWIAERHPVSSETPQPIPTQFIPVPQAHWLATSAEISQVLANFVESTRLLDARPSEQFTGLAVWTPAGSLYLPPDRDWVEVEGRPMRSGHIPGAVSLPAIGNLSPADNWRFLRPQHLGARALAVGIRPEHRVISYCGAGIAASQSLFALYLAGYRNLALYDASWEEWGTNPIHPIKKTPPGAAVEH